MKLKRIFRIYLNGVEMRDASGMPIEIQATKEDV